MKFSHYVFLLFISVPLGRGMSFTLTELQSGEVSGPFVCTNQARICLAGAVYVVTCEQTQEGVLPERLASIVLPALEFRHAALPDVLAYLAEASRGADPEGVGVNIVLLPPVQDQRESADELAQKEFPFNINMQGLLRTPHITLNLHHVSLGEALRMVAEVAEYTYRIDDHGVVVFSSKPDAD